MRKNQQSRSSKIGGFLVRKLTIFGERFQQVLEDEHRREGDDGRGKELDKFPEVLVGSLCEDLEDVLRGDFKRELIIFQVQGHATECLPKMSDHAESSRMIECVVVAEHVVGLTQLQHLLEEGDHELRIPTGKFDEETECQCSWKP